MTRNQLVDLVYGQCLSLQYPSEVPADVIDACRFQLQQLAGDSNNVALSQDDQRQMIGHFRAMLPPGQFYKMQVGDHEAATIFQVVAQNPGAKKYVEKVCFMGNNVRFK